MTGISKRTLWRRIAGGRIKKLGEDSRGRAMLCLADVVMLIDVPMNDEDHEILLLADQGDAQAQADIGAMTYAAGAFSASIYWLQQSAAQQNRDAMQWLGSSYASGHGVPRDTNLALMWIARSAALGHSVAQQQIQSLIRHSL